MTRRTLVRDTLGFAVAQYLVRAAFMARGVIAARLLGPAAYGAWNALMLVIEYGATSHLGTQQGLDRLAPQRIVEGDAARLRRLERAGLANMVMLSLLYAVVVMAYFARNHGEIRGYWGLPGIALALACVLLGNVANAHLTLIRSHGNIGAVSRWFVLQAVVSVGLGLGLIPWLGAWALLWGWFAGLALGLAFARVAAPPGTAWRPGWSEDSTRLFRTGFPMILYLSSNLMLRTVDRIVVLRFEGSEVLGLYVLGVMALTLVMNLPDSICYVLYPQLLRAFAQAGDRPEAIRDRVRRTLTVFSVLLPGLGGLVFLGAREAVILVLPAFVGGAGVLRVLCFGALGLALANLGAIVLMTTDAKGRLMAIAIASAALGAGLDIWALRAGHGIEGVAWAMFGTYAATGATMLGVGALTLGLGPRAALALVARAFAPLVIAMVLAVGLDRLAPAAWPALAYAGWGRVLPLAVAFAGLYALAMQPFVRGLGLGQALAEARVPGFGGGSAPEGGA